MEGSRTRKAPALLGGNDGWGSGTDREWQARVASGKQQVPALDEEEASDDDGIAAYDDYGHGTEAVPTPGEGSSQSSAPRKLTATQLAAQQLVDEVRLSGGCAHVSLTA